MQIVIDIDEDTYKDIKRGKIYTSVRDVPQESVLAIANGTPLPTDAVDRVTIKEYLESFGKDTNVSATDCISREAVMHILDEVGGDFDSPREAVVPIDYIADMVSELPPVTPQPKMGRWIEHFDESGKWYECDQCHTDWGGSVNYCPNCGSKM